VKASKLVELNGIEPSTS